MEFILKGVTRDRWKRALRKAAEKARDHQGLKDKRKEGPLLTERSVEQTDSPPVDDDVQNF